ncbi:MAG: hypothetical protein LUC41_05935 [Clostridiales bacterium]|nr:hypothetical protein [Clostridiales bacterium]
MAILIIIIILVLIFATVILFRIRHSGLYSKPEGEDTQPEKEAVGRDNTEEEDRGVHSFTASKRETDAARNISLEDEALYSRCLPATDNTSAVRDLRKRICAESGIQPTPEMMTCAILSQKGRIPYEMEWGCYQTTRTEPCREYRNVESKFLKWLDTELIRNGMYTNIKYLPEDIFIDSEARPVQEINVPGMGKYYWSRDQIYFSTLTMITYPYKYDAPYNDY